ncbi:MAG: tRNA 2-thiouridine(34) synthase MnmA [Lachnospiraceae bacterium]|nr:tRNA 2-thiouridine(34) synthase MnmA [Lachnospiraceae bacterium]
MKALIAMSGGVDSSVAASMVKNMGFECVGCTMKLFVKETDGEVSNDIKDAGAVCEKLGIPFYVLDLKEEFKDKVINKFCESYKKGETPNPCVECNRHMKFARLFEKAKELGCEYIATGHYARIEKTDNGYLLKKALDPKKDQSYVLFRLTQEDLSHILLPLGEKTKEDAREMAENLALVTAHKSDSQDICFVPDGDYAKVMEKYTDNLPGPGNFVTLSGEVLGRHKGIHHYTIGQRRGLAIPADRRLYVVEINADKDLVILGDDKDLFTKEVYAEDVNWISGKAPEAGFRCSARVRYHHQEKSGTIIYADDNTLKFEFDEPQRAVTPGQAVVLYLGDTVLGGGRIRKDTKTR